MCLLRRRFCTQESSSRSSCSLNWDQFACSQDPPRILLSAVWGKNSCVLPSHVGTLFQMSFSPYFGFKCFIHLYLRKISNLFPSHLLRCSLEYTVILNFIDLFFEPTSGVSERVVNTLRGWNLALHSKRSAHSDEIFFIYSEICRRFWCEGVEEAKVAVLTIWDGRAREGDCIMKLVHFVDGILV